MFWLLRMKFPFNTELPVVLISDTSFYTETQYIEISLAAPLLKNIKSFKKTLISQNKSF